MKYYRSVGVILQSGAMRMKPLAELLNLPKVSDKPHFEYLPVVTSLAEELQKEADELLKNRFKSNSSSHASENFQSNETLENIKNDLVLMKLKGYIDPRDITGKATEMKKLPSKVQVGTMIDGDPIQTAKLRNKKKDNDFIDYFLSKDKGAEFTNKKFNEIQRLKQRKKKIKKKVLAKKQKLGKRK